MHELRREMHEGFAGVDRRFEHMGQDLGALRSDLTHVALPVGARRPPQASEG